MKNYTMELVIFFSTTPYSSENTHTFIKLADAVLRKGHKVRFITSGDGVFSTVKGQLPKAMSALGDLIGRGLIVNI